MFKPFVICRIFYKRVFKIIAKYVPGYQFRRFFLRGAGYSIGENAFIGEDLIIIDELEDGNRLTVGERVAIAPRVTLVISSRPNFSRISEYVRTDYGPITIKNDAWIGTGAIIMPNVTIGEGAVVGAASFVVEDVPPFTVVAGVPAKPIKKLILNEHKPL